MNKKFAFIFPNTSGGVFVSSGETATHLLNVRFPEENEERPEVREFIDDARAGWIHETKSGRAIVCIEDGEN